MAPVFKALQHRGVAEQANHRIKYKRGDDVLERKARGTDREGGLCGGQNAEEQPDVVGRKPVRQQE